MSELSKQLKALDVMHEEWLAWQNVVHEFKELQLDINADTSTPLVKVIQLWGEELVRLRLGQTREVQVHALEEARTQYSPPQSKEE